MANKMIRQTMFNTGEVDVVTWKRTEVNEYLTAAQSLFNCEVGTTGLAKKRKGTSVLLNVTAYAQFNSHMYEFVDKNGDYYVILSAAGTWYVFATPDDSVQVITNTGANVVTAYGTNVVAHSESLIFVQAITGMPYTTGDLDNIDYAQDNDSLVLSHPNFPTGRIFIDSYASDPPHFSFEFLNIYPLPAYDFNTINYNNFTVSLSVSGSVLTFNFTGVGADPGFTSAWIGGQIIGGGASDIQPIGYAIITAVSYSSGGGGTVTFTATVQIPFQTSGFATSGAQYSIRQPSWSSALGYPAKVLFFQNRLWLANTATLPNTIFGSKINTPISFDVGTGRDTDAIIYTIGQTNSGAINWLNGGKQLEVFCQNLEFACPQDQGSGLTPSTFSIRQQSSYGASGILKPVTYINDSYFVSKTGSAFLNYHFTGVGLAYNTSNISAASQHLVKNPTNRALLRGSDTSQDNFIYYLNPDDDTITAFQFAAEYKLAALTPFQFQARIQLVDIATIDNTIYILKYYELTGQYNIEVFDNNVRVDGAITVNMPSNGIITGLSALNGYTVQVVFENQDFGQYLVSGGQITVNNPDSLAGETTIGLLYDVNIIPMYPFAGAQESPFFKQIQRVYVDYYNSLNFTINGNLVPYLTFAEIQAGAPLIPKTDTAIISPFTGWNRFDQPGNVPVINITQTSPFDLQILGISYQIAAAVL